MTNLQVKRFVQDILGCSCPEEVFDKIDCVADVFGPQVKEYWKTPYGRCIIARLYNADELTFSASLPSG